MGGIIMRTEHKDPRSSIHHDTLHNKFPRVGVLFGSVWPVVSTAVGALGEGEYDADPWCPSPLAINHPSQWRKRGTKIEALQVQHNTSNCWTRGKICQCLPT